MTTEREINLFQMVVLKNVIELYIETGRPVSSRTLKSRFRLGQSSAKIRNTLHELEEMGLLFKPHVSAGRIPTDRGYRRYVDELDKPGPLSRDLIDRIRYKIGRDRGDIRDLMLRTSRMLGEFTQCMGLMMGIFHSYGDVERLRIAQLEGNAAMVIINIEGGADRKVYVDFPKRYRPHIVDRAVQIINERISGYPLEEAHERLESYMKECTGTDRDITARIAAEADLLFDTPYDIRYHFDALTAVADSPEMNNPKILQRLVRLMGERSLMLSIMRERMNDGIMITIGRENPMSELRDFSIITKNFRGEDCDGLFGVLGPTRMSYKLVLSLLNSLGIELEDTEARIRYM